MVPVTSSIGDCAVRCTRHGPRAALGSASAGRRPWPTRDQPSPRAPGAGTAGAPKFAWNGSTGPERVTFWCEGTQEQVAWFLEEVAANIRALPLRHLEQEKNLLRAEACHRNGGVAGMHDVWRWGATGHGLGIQDELGFTTSRPSEGAGVGRPVPDGGERRTVDDGRATSRTRPTRTALALPAPEPGAWRATATPSCFPSRGHEDHAVATLAAGSLGRRHGRPARQAAARAAALHRGRQLQRRPRRRDPSAATCDGCWSRWTDCPTGCRTSPTARPRCCASPGRYRPHG